MDDLTLDLRKFVPLADLYGQGRRHGLNSITVNQHTISIGKSALEHAGMKPTSKSLQVVFRVHIGPPAAILLLPPEKAEAAHEIYNASRSPAKTNHRYAMGVPAGMKQVQLPRGTYNAVPNQPGVFVLDAGPAEEVTPDDAIKNNYYKEDPQSIEKGDIVSWPLPNPKDGGQTFATGLVSSVRPAKSNPQNHRLTIAPISQSCEEYGGNRVIVIMARKAIIRRKYNA